MVVKNPEDWRAITPWTSIANLVVSICVSVIGFFLVMTLNDLRDAIRIHTQKIDQIVSDQHRDELDNAQKYTQIRYQCCSELKNYPGRDVENGAYKQD